MIDRSEFEVPCLEGRQKDLEIEVPGSKSLTNRALLLAALADGTSTLEGALFSEDSRHFLQGLIDLGFAVEADEEKKIVRVTGLGGRLPERTGRVYVGSAGTAARFLTAMLAFAGGTYELDASEQMRKRPMKPLLEALERLGVQVTYQGEEGCFPFVLQSEGITGGEVSIDIGISSQFLSALLMAGTMLPEGLRIHLTGERKALPYAEMTASLMERFGVRVHQEQIEGSGEKVWIVPGREELAKGAGVTKTGAKTKTEEEANGFSGGYRAGEYEIEPDLSGACYFYAMALLLGISVRVRRVHLDSLQGDKRFLQVLEQLGCRVEDTPEGVRVDGRVTDMREEVRADGQVEDVPDGVQADGRPEKEKSEAEPEKGKIAEKAETKAENNEMVGEPENGKMIVKGSQIRYPGIAINMNDFSDQTMTMAAVAAFAETPTQIEGVGHIRFQESDRIAAICTELGRLGIRCEEQADGLAIYPGKVKAGRIQTYEDHRMAMAFALIGLRVPGIVIENPGCCAKTFENYFDLLEEISM